MIDQEIKQIFQLAERIQPKGFWKSYSAIIPIL